MEKVKVVPLLDTRTNKCGGFKNFPEFAGKIYRNCQSEYRNLHWNPSSSWEYGYKEMQRKIDNQPSVLLRDNAPAHRPVLVNDFLAKNNMTALEHPPLSPDLAPAEFFYLFPR